MRVGIQTLGQAKKVRNSSISGELTLSILSALFAE